MSLNVSEVDSTAVLAYICPDCARQRQPGIIAISDTRDPNALRAHEGILVDHAQWFGHTIEVVDLEKNQQVGFIPRRYRLS